jgi:hypothetical protein
LGLQPVCGDAEALGKFEVLKVYFTAAILEKMIQET